MTQPMMDLRAPMEKSADADLLREMLGFAAERLMELEVGAKTGADYGEKSSDRLAQRNGYRDRDWQTRAGSVELRIPPMSLCTDNGAMIAAVGDLLVRSGAGPSSLGIAADPSAVLHGAQLPLPEGFAA